MAEAKYPLGDLLNVRYYREDKAKKAINTAKRLVEEAKEAVERAHKELEDYRIWLAEEETRRYEAIMGKPCSVQSVDEVKQGINLLKAKEVQYIEKIEKAKQAVIEAENNLENAKKALSVAQQETQKIIIHKDIWMQAVKIEVARAEDLEMEEFKPKDTNEFED